MSDNVNHPQHYKIFKKEVIDIIQDCLSNEEFLGYIKGNIIKYRMRAGWKGGVAQRQEDLEKANWYQNLLFQIHNNNHEEY